MMKKVLLLLRIILLIYAIQLVWADNIKIEQSLLIDNGIVEFVPEGYDVSQSPFAEVNEGIGENSKNSAELDLVSLTYCGRWRR